MPTRRVSMSKIRQILEFRFDHKFGIYPAKSASAGTDSAPKGSLIFD